MSIQIIQPARVYTARQFQGTSNTITIGIYDNKGIYDNSDLEVNGETVLTKEFADDSIDECRMPTESELRQARLMNIPTRGFCVSSDLEKINADSYRYSYDPEEFAPPDI